MNQFCLNAHRGSPKICHGTFQAQFLFWIHLLKKKLIFFRECLLKYLVETYHHRIFLKDDHSPPQSKDIWDVSETIMKFLIILGDMVEFLDGNSLRWKMLEMQMPWLDIDVRVIFKNEDVVDGSVVKLISSTIPKAYNRWPLKNDDFAESFPFGKGKIFMCLLTYSGVPPASPCCSSFRPSSSLCPLSSLSSHPPGTWRRFTCRVSILERQMDL